MSDFDDLDRTERFSLGTILVKLQLVSRAEVDAVLEIQGSLSPDENLGELLVARGLVDREQLEIALAAQRDLRSSDRATRALAAARLADISTENVLSLSRRVREESRAARRDSNQHGYPAVRVPITGEEKG